LVVDPAYGGPEFETLIMLGSNLGVGDIAVVTKASELVNKLGLDSVATGSMIGFAMECFERGAISERQTGGLELRFGRGDVVLELIEMIASRRGLGDVLADGYPRAIAEWGGAAAAFAVQVKNQGFPAHMARVKKSQAIGYAVCPIGPDHMASEHDWLAAADSDVPRGLGLTVFTDWPSFDRAKVRASLFSQFYMSLLDSLTLCMFPWGLGSLLGPRDLEDLVFACTGWRVTFWELMKAGERRLNLMRAFNAREGLGRDDDALPPRVFEPLQGGPADGARVDPRVFAEALEGFYAMAGWAPETGAPTAGKLIELGLDAFVPHERSHGG
jgi:aldehyde:ferredoxin oxidoreductase